MHPYKRSVRVGDLIKKETADIIMHRLRDPRIGFVTVTDARVTDDLRHATIYVSVLEDKKREMTINVLSTSKPFIRSELGKRLKMRYIPSIYFKIDEAVEYGKKIDKILDEVSVDETDEEGEDPV